MSQSLTASSPHPASTPPVPLHTPRLLPSNSYRSPSSLNPQNLKSNIDVGASLQDLLNGDDDHKSYTLVSPGQPCAPADTWRSQVLRIYFQNVNGLKLYDNGADILDAFFHMETIRADIFGFVETKLDFRQPSVLSTIHKQKRKVWDHCKLELSSSNSPWHSPIKPGGTLIGVTGPLVGRAHRTLSDDLGRWSGMECLGRDGRTLLILCAYQVPLASGSAGQLTARAQQISILRQRGFTCPNPRTHFINDLKKLITTYHSQSADIILMGDFNESIGIRADAMASVLQAGSLTDVQSYCHGLECEQPTYARGRTRVDYLFVSNRLLPFIIRQGCEPFNARIFSDHRGLFMDISYPGIFDRSPNILAPLSRRGFIYDCTRHVQKYLKFMDQYLKDHNLPTRIQHTLEDSRDDAAAESIDRDLTAGFLAVDRLCRSTPRSPWSPALHQAITTKYIISRHLSQLLTHRDMSTSIASLQASLSQPVSLPPSVTATQHALRNAQRECRLVVRKAKDLAQVYQAERIRAKQLANPDIEPTKIERLLKHRDAARDMWKRIPSYKPKASGGISMIKTPTDPSADPKHPDTTFRTVVDPAEMEQLLLARNRRHFGQAQDNPLASLNLSDQLGWGAQHPLADDILAGHADVSLLSPDIYAQSILNSCTRRNPELASSISMETMQRFYLHWRARTSTSPSGRHLSHQHILFQPHGIPFDQEEECTLLNDTKALLWQAHHFSIQYATTHGFCFSRWHNVVNSMIEKEPGNPALYRLRVIHLYESDYNLILGCKFREVTHYCQDQNQFNPGCYGGLANKRSLDPVFLENMQYDYTMLTRSDSIKFANDAGSCYDRIIASPSNLIARSMGLHRHIAALHGLMLESAIYRIKTQLGISSTSYSHSPDHPIHGTGQGSRSSSLVWGLNGSLYFDIFDKVCYGAQYVDPDASNKLKIGMAGFVDDNSVQVNCHPDDRDTLGDKAQHDAQLWNDILWSSGGILEHDKCSYHYLHTDFDLNGAPVLRSGSHGPTIQIADNNGTLTTLKQLSAYSSYKTLGTYQSPGSNSSGQLTAIMKKAQILIRTLALSSCSGHSAWLYYSSVFCPSVGYPLAVSRLSVKQIKSIQGPMIPLILNRLSYEARLPHALAFGPRRFGGLGLPTLVSHKIHSQLSLALRHLRIHDQPGILQRINHKRLQLTAGVSFSIFEHPSRPLPHLEGVWLTHFRQTLALIQAKITISDLPLYPIQREHDFFLMDTAIHSPDFTDRDIRFINYCRLYLRSLTISDITLASGTKLAPGVISGMRTPFQSVSTLHDAYQERPGSLAWRAWRRFLRLFSTSDGTLFQPLGPWTLPHHKLRRTWPYLYSPSTDILYRNRLNQYSALPRYRPRVYRHTNSTTTVILPLDCIPVDATPISDGWRLDTYLPILPPPSIVLPLSFPEYIHSLPDHERCALLRHELLCSDIFSFISLVSDLSDVLLVSDGGAEGNFGSFGWTICLSDGSRLARGSGSVFGLTPGSYRSEISGCRSGLLFIIHAFLFSNTPLPPGKLQIYCDNSGFIKKMHRFRQFRLSAEACCLDSEWDLLISVHSLCQKFPELPPFYHIKGHQDRHTDFHDLPLPAQLNVESDHLATLELSQHSNPLPDVPFDPISRAVISINGVTVTSRLEHAVSESLYFLPLKHYLCHRFKWSSPTFDTIDWDAFSSVYSKYPRSRTFFYKFSWKKLPCGSRVHRREAHRDDRCPLCASPQESDDHIFQCSHHTKVQWRRSFFQGLTKQFSFLDPELLDMITFGLKGFFKSDPTYLHHRFPEPFPPLDSDSSSSSESLLSNATVHFHTSDSDSITLASDSTRSSDSTDSVFSRLPDSDASDSDYDPLDFDFDPAAYDPLLFALPPPSTNPYIQLRRSQDTIGWDHFFRGKLSSEWATLQSQYADRHPSHPSSKNWQTLLIRYMATQSHSIWLLRNKSRHGHDAPTRHRQALALAHSAVRSLYQLRDQVLAQDRDLFCSSLDTHLQQPLGQLQGWLSLNKTLIQSSVRAARRKAQANTRPLRAFFPQSTATKSRKKTPNSKNPSVPTFRPSRVTQFFSILPRRDTPLTSIREQPPPSQSRPPRPRQRYLHDFFSDHPG